MITNKVTDDTYNDIKEDLYNIIEGITGCKNTAKAAVRDEKLAPLVDKYGDTLDLYDVIIGSYRSKD